jgi:ribosomal protein S18 acetylase RimI-like enzyme
MGQDNMVDFEGEKLNFEIQEAVVADVESIQVLNKKLFEYEDNEGHSENLDLDWSLSEEGRKEIEERITNKESSCGFVCKINGKLAGYLIGRVLEEETGRAESKYAEIEHMITDDEYGRQGIGENLVQEFKAWVKSKGLKTMKANVSYKNEKAINFYKKVGLSPSDVMMTMDVE